MAEKRYHAHIINKAIAFWGVFVVLYLLYKYFPNYVFSIFCAVNESNFQHYKAGFFAYTFVSLVEFSWKRRRISDTWQFVYSRMAAAIILPWIIFLLWYVAPALIGRWPNNMYEIVYANIITIIVGVFAAVFERGMETAEFSRALRAVLVVLFFVSILLYFRFTFQLPWADVFVEPDWR